MAYQALGFDATPGGDEVFRGLGWPASSNRRARPTHCGARGDRHRARRLPQRRPSPAEIRQTCCAPGTVSGECSREDWGLRRWCLDRRTTMGSRDYALLVVLSRLGLRAY